METPETPVNTVFSGLIDAIEGFGHLAPVQQAIFTMAFWMVLSLLPQVRILAARAQGKADWQVVWFRGALMFMGACVALRYFFGLNPWLIVIGWLVFNIASTMNAVYIVQRSRESETQRLAREVEEARLLLAEMEPRRPRDV